MSDTTSSQITETLPAFPEFTKLTIAHDPIIRQYTDQFPAYSDFTFSVLWCWGMDRCYLSDAGGNLVIQLPNYTSDHMFLSFIGRQQVNETIALLLAMIQDSDHLLPYLQAIPEDAMSGISLDTSYQITEDMNNNDYICELSMLAKMAGNRYERIRNMANCFRETYPWQVKKIDLREPNHTRLRG